MITRAYQNAKGERQEVTLPKDQWEVLTEDALNDMLGFAKPETEAAPKAVSVRRRRR